MRKTSWLDVRKRVKIDEFVILYALVLDTKMELLTFKAA